MRVPSRIAVVLSCALGFAVLATKAPVLATDRFSGWAEGATRIVDQRTLLRFDHAIGVEDLSPDGRYLVITECVEPQGDDFCEARRLAILDLVTQRLRRYKGTAGETWHARISPKGWWVLFRDEEELKLLDARRGGVTSVWRDEGDGRFAWLDDGRYVLLDGSNHLRTWWPGWNGQGRWLGPSLGSSPPATWAVSPDGSQVAYTDVCVGWLMDLVTGSRVGLGEKMAIPSRSWDPSSERFVVWDLDRGWKCQHAPHAAYGDFNGIYEVVLRRDGGRIGRPFPRWFGHTHFNHPYWSTDGRWLLVTHNSTGTCTGGDTMLMAASMDDRTHRQVLTYRVVSGVFAGPGGWIVWAKFDPGPYATCIRTPDEGRLVLGRLVET